MLLERQSVVGTRDRYLWKADSSYLLTISGHAPGRINHDIIKFTAPTNRKRHTKDLGVGHKLQVISESIT